MKWVSLAVGLAILGFAVNKYYLTPHHLNKFEDSTPPPAPPPPPPVEEPPPPVLDEKAFEKIRLSTKDSTPEVRWEAVQLLVTSGHPEADTFLFEMLQRDTEPSLRLRALDALKSRPGPKVTNAIIRALRDTEPEVKLAALDGISGREDVDASVSVSELVGDSDERVRLAAIRTLNNLNERREQKKREAAERNQRAQAEYEEKMKQYQEAQERAAKQKGR